MEYGILNKDDDRRCETECAGQRLGAAQGRLSEQCYRTTEGISARERPEKRASREEKESKTGYLMIIFQVFVHIIISKLSSAQIIKTS
jgi:hypothetical protein